MNTERPRPPILNNLNEGFEILKALPRVAANKLGEVNRDFQTMDQTLRGVRIGKRAPRRK